MKEKIVAFLRSKTEKKELHIIENNEVEKTNMIVLSNSGHRHYDSFIEHLADELVRELNKTPHDGI